MQKILRNDALRSEGQDRIVTGGSMEFLCFTGGDYLHFRLRITEFSDLPLSPIPQRKDF